MRKIACAFFLATSSIIGFAQSGTNSPYSQYGLGTLSEQASGFSRGMNGLGVAFHDHNQVNNMNPASYSAIDSLSFIFDAGFSGQLTNFEEGGKKLNARNADFDYVVAGFRALRHFGVSFGLIPFTNIGYSYSNTQYVNSLNTTTYTNTYSGSGGLHEVYLGFGWEIFKGFSVGANGAYLWGDLDRSVVNSYSDGYINTLSKYYTVSVQNYKVDFGFQYTARLSRKDWLTIGGTYGLGHKLNADPQCQVISTNSQTAVSDTAVYVVKNGLELPVMIGAGVMYNHNGQLKFGVDYSLQKWAKIETPEYSVVNGTPQYALTSGVYSDRHKFTVGGEYIPLENARNIFKRIHYRAGASYATSYFKVNGIDGPKEFSVSAGVGIPIMNSFNSRSLLNISAQWVRMDSKSLIKENTFRINVGLTFNERWFDKWKVR